MRSSVRSLLLLAVLFFVGCGGGDRNDAGSDFVFTGTTAAASRALTFNFLRAQETAALSVPADTTQIRFRFYSGVGGGGALLQEELRDFAASITIDPVHVATQSYVITALSNQGYPLLEVTANLAPSESEVDLSGLNPVAVTPERLTLTPASTTVEVGQSVQFESFVLFSNGETVPAAATDVTWEATFQATIDAQGLATGTADGISTVKGTFRTVTATANMVIGQGLLLTRLEVTPDNASVGLGSDIPFSVVGFDQNENPFDLNGLTVVWSATGDASIDAATGVATGDSVVPNTLAGSATITATIETVSDSTSLTVIALPGNLLSVTTTPDPLIIDLDNPTGNLSTSGDFQNGPDQVLTNAQHGLVYSVTGNPGVASVNVVTGEVTAIAQGTTQITASAGGQSDTVMVQVNFGAAGNQAPSITVSSAPVNLGGLGATPVAAFPAATVADPTQASFVGGTLTIEAVAPGNQNVVIALPATPDIGTIQTNNAASVSINLTTSATEAQVQALLRGVTVFANSIGTGDLQISLDDGQGATGTASRSFVAATGGLTLGAGAHTYDTDTGALNGVVDPNLSGTRLAFLSFDLQAGATLTVTGSNAFVVGVTGDAVVDGLIDADGEDAAAADPGNNGASTDGGAGGPGGFAGGGGGGGGATPVRPINGENGLGPGGGQGGSLTGPNGVDSMAGGGGAGHLTAGANGISRGTAVAGQGGSAYLSIPGLLIGGSGGGGGSAEADGGPPEDDGGPGGGGGGGAVRILAFGTISVGGTIDCSGGAGGNAPGFSGGGGGGGSGGAIELLASIVPTITGLLDVSGGVGGVREVYGTNGGSGSEGRTNVGAF